MNQSLVDRLVATLSAPRGVIRKDPILRLAEMFGPEGNLEKFVEWLNLDTTQAMLEVLRDLAVNTPPPIASPDVHVQYGVTSGLQLALKILEDPTILFPNLFAPAAAEPPEADYSTSPDHDQEEPTA